MIIPIITAAITNIVKNNTDSGTSPSSICAILKLTTAATNSISPKKISPAIILNAIICIWPPLFAVYLVFLLRTPSLICAILSA